MSSAPHIDALAREARLLEHNTLVLCMDAPLMSFGGVVMDGSHPTARFPFRSMLTGLLGNALGLDRAQFDELEALQVAFSFASRWDVEPVLLRDYQNVDLASPKMNRKTWTSQGTVIDRTTNAKNATHQTERMYWSDGVLTAVLHFEDAAWVPRLVTALKRPARPFFYGRKTCVPASPLLRSSCRAESVLEALGSVPVLSLDLARRPLSKGSTVSIEVDLPALFAERLSGRVVRETVPSGMDMRNRIHSGAEPRVRAVLTLPVASVGAVEMNALDSGDLLYAHD